MLPGGEARIRTGGKGFAGLCLTTWPLRRKRTAQTVRKCNGADNGARTRDPNLGKVVLYQLSHVRLRGLILRDTRILCKNFFEKFCDALANLAKTSATTEGAGKRKLTARGPYISPSIIQAELSCASLPSASGDEVSRTLPAGSSTGAVPKFVTHAQPLSRR